MLPSILVFPLQCSTGAIHTSISGGELTIPGLSEIPLSTIASLPMIENVISVPLIVVSYTELLSVKESPPAQQYFFVYGNQQRDLLPLAFFWKIQEGLPI